MTERARLFLTRPEAASRRFLAACEAARGAPVPAVLSPVMAIRPVEIDLERPPAALILTSENGAGRAGELGLAPRVAWCVGPRTAAEARRAGLRAIEAGSDAETLLAALLTARPAGRLLHLRGEHARGELAESLRGAGLDVQEAVAYRQEALQPTSAARAALDGRDPLVAPLFSPRSAALLAAWRPRAPLHVVAMSPTVAEVARSLRPVSLSVARSPESGAMVEATLAALASRGASPA